MLECRRDVESDLSALHGLRRADAYALDGPEFLALAYRLPAYEGAVRARVRRWAREEEAGRPPLTHSGAARVTTVKATPEAIGADPVLSRYIEIK